MNKRSISLILIIVFSLCIVLNTAQPSLALSTDQTDALNAYYKILSSFEWESGKPVYPDDYGGEYIDGSLLYVWIVHKNPMNQWKYEKLCEGSEYVRFLDAAYSLNELERLAEELMVSGKDYNISGHYVDRVNNKLCMCVAPNGGEFNETAYAELTYCETVEALTNLWKENAERVVFREQDWLNIADSDDQTIIDESASINLRDTIELIGGTTLYAKAPVVGASPNPGTLGFCGTCTMNGVPYDAILTAGHVITEAKDPASSTVNVYNVSVSNDNKYAESWLYKSGGIDESGISGDNIGDYAICKKQLNSYDLTNKVKYSTGTVSIAGSTMQGWLPVGTYVSCYGGISGYHLGTVSALNIGGLADGIYVTGLVSVNMPGIVEGDSGGPVYSYIQVGNQAYGYNAQGTIAGYTSLNMLYSPISYPIARGFSVATS